MTHVHRVDVHAHRIQRARHPGLDARLHPSAEPCAEELLGRPCHGERGLALPESVSLVCRQQIGDGNASSVQRYRDLVRLRLRHPRVVRAL